MQSDATFPGRLGFRIESGSVSVGDPFCRAAEVTHSAGPAKPARPRFFFKEKTQHPLLKQIVKIAIVTSFVLDYV